MFTLPFDVKLLLVEFAAPKQVTSYLGGAGGSWGALIRRIVTFTGGTDNTTMSAPNGTALSSIDYYSLFNILCSRSPMVGQVCDAMHPVACDNVHTTVTCSSGIVHSVDSTPVARMSTANVYLDFTSTKTVDGDIRGTKGPTFGQNVMVTLGGIIHTLDTPANNIKTAFIETTGSYTGAIKLGIKSISYNGTSYTSYVCGTFGTCSNVTLSGTSTPTHSKNRVVVRVDFPVAVNITKIFGDVTLHEAVYRRMLFVPAGVTIPSIVYWDGFIAKYEQSCAEESDVGTACMLPDGENNGCGILNYVVSCGAREVTGVRRKPTSFDFSKSIGNIPGTNGKAYVPGRGIRISIDADYVLPRPYYKVKGVIIEFVGPITLGKSGCSPFGNDALESGNGYGAGVIGCVYNMNPYSYWRAIDGFGTATVKLYNGKSAGDSWLFVNNNPQNNPIVLDFQLETSPDITRLFKQNVGGSWLSIYRRITFYYDETSPTLSTRTHAHGHTYYEMLSAEFGKCGTGSFIGDRCYAPDMYLLQPCGFALHPVVQCNDGAVSIMHTAPAPTTPAPTTTTAQTTTTSCTTTPAPTTTPCATTCATMCATNTSTPTTTTAQTTTTAPTTTSCTTAPAPTTTPAPPAVTERIRNLTAEQSSMVIFDLTGANDRRRDTTQYFATERDYPGGDIFDTDNPYVHITYNMKRNIMPEVRAQHAVIEWTGPVTFPSDGASPFGADVTDYYAGYGYGGIGTINRWHFTNYWKGSEGFGVVSVKILSSVGARDITTPQLNALTGDNAVLFSWTGEKFINSIFGSKSKQSWLGKYKRITFLRSEYNITGLTLHAFHEDVVKVSGLCSNNIFTPCRTLGTGRFKECRNGAVTVNCFEGKMWSPPPPSPPTAKSGLCMKKQFLISVIREKYIAPTGRLCTIRGIRPYTERTTYYEPCQLARARPAQQFKVLWNVFNTCGGLYEALIAAGIEPNTGMTWRTGDELSIHYSTPITLLTGAPMCQLVNHAEKMRESAASVMAIYKTASEKEKKSFVVLDQEEYRWDFRQLYHSLFGSLMAATRAHAGAINDETDYSTRLYNEAVDNVGGSIIREYHRESPTLKFGYYSPWPLTDSSPETWYRSGAFFPSFYHTPPVTGFRRTANAIDMRNRFGVPNTPIMPYVFLLDYVSPEYRTYKSITVPALSGADGVVFWESSDIWRTSGTCDTLKTFLSNYTSDAIHKAKAFLNKCSLEKCNNNGKCVLKVAPPSTVTELMDDPSFSKYVTAHQCRPPVYP
jgi:hypothetical protein